MKKNSQNEAFFKVIPFSMLFLAMAIFIPQLHAQDLPTDSVQVKETTKQVTSRSASKNIDEMVSSKAFNVVLGVIITTILSFLARGLKKKKERKPAVSHFSIDNSTNVTVIQHIFSNINQNGHQVNSMPPTDKTHDKDKAVKDTTGLK